MTWIEIADLKGGKGDKGDVGPMGGFQTGQAAPSNLLNAYGGTFEGSYRVATDAAANAITGSPLGAKAGNVSIWPLGSAAAILVWRNQADGREWQRSVGSISTYITDWVETLRKGSKRVAEPLTLAGPVNVNTSTSVGVRIPFRVPASVRRWRVYVRNHNDRTTTAYTGALSFTGVTIGKGGTDANGRPTGQFDGGKFPVSSSFTSDANGAQWASLWQTYALEPNQEYVLSYGYTSPAGQQNYASVGGGFLTTGGALALNTDATGLTKTQNVPLDVWIAFEVDEHVPQYGYWGDSLTAGVSADLPVYDSWAKRHAHANGAFAQIYAYSGTGYTEWASDLKFGLNKWTTFSGIRKPEVLYNAMGSNDLGPSDVTLMKSRMAPAIAAVRKVVCSEVVNVTILPRLDGTDSFEVNRKAWNQYLIDQVPGGALMTVDAASALTDATGDLLDTKWRAAPTDIHLNYAGYAHYANAVERGSGGGVGPVTASVATLAALPVSNVTNRGQIMFVVSENKPYYSNGTAWGPVATGAQGQVGPPGAGVPTGGTGLQIVRKNSAGTTTEWVTPTKSLIGLGSVDNTPDVDKPVSTATQAALDAKVDPAQLEAELGGYLNTELLSVIPGSGSLTKGDLVKVGNFAFVSRLDVNMGIVQGGGNLNENVIGGNLANVNTSTSNLTGAPVLTGNDGNWNFIMNGYDNVANGWAIILNGFHNKVAEGANHATVAGGSIHSIEANVNYATIGGGTGNTVKTGGSAGTIAGGINHELTGSSATVGGGTGNKSNGFHSTVGGGGSNEVTGNMSATISGGEGGIASGAGAVIPGGNGNTASGYHSTAAGRGSIAPSGGMRSYGAQFTAAGDAQDSTVIMKRESLNATAAGLSCDGSSGLVIPENTTWAISGLIVARRADVDGESAAFEFKAVFKRDIGNTAALVGTPVVTSIGANAGNTWAVTIGSASAGNLNVTTTGEAGKTIRWVATLRIAHVSV